MYMSGRDRTSLGWAIFCRAVMLERLHRRNIILSCFGAHAASRIYLRQILCNCVALASVVAAYTLHRRRRRLNRIDDAEALKLAKLVFSRLLAQRTHAGHVAPSYLAAVQLRDSLLDHQLPLTVRMRRWVKVTNLVEKNTNVRANVVETVEGDETRVWQWIGLDDCIAVSASPLCKLPADSFIS